MEGSTHDRNKKQWLTTVALLTFSVLASVGLIYQQSQIQDLQSDLDHVNAIVASQNYKSELTWERLLCAERQEISPDEVFAAWYDKDGTIMLECAASDFGPAKKFQLMQSNDSI